MPGPATFASYRMSSSGPSFSAMATPLPSTRHGSGANCLRTRVRGHCKEGRLGRLDRDREKEMIEAALADSGGRIAGPSGAAARLGIPRQTLESKIASLGIKANPAAAGAKPRRPARSPNGRKKVTGEPTASHLV